MKKIILLTLLPLFSIAQRDTIVSVPGVLIPCKILEEHKDYLRYTPVKGWDKTIAIGDVAWYSRKGKKTILKSVTTQTVQVDETKRDLAFIQYCLKKSHQKFSTGASVFFIGMVFSGVSILSYGSGSSDLGGFFAGTSGLCYVTGGIIMINSHKWIGRAGAGFTGNGYGFVYKLR